jgi:hypothetical protein
MPIAVRSLIRVIPVAKKDDVNKVLEAMGLGPTTITKDASPIAGGPVTHCYGHDASASEADAIAAMRITDDGGTLPDISGNAEGFTTWLDWFPEAANETAAQARAKAACAVMEVPVAANKDGREHLDGILLGKSLKADEVEI